MVLKKRPLSTALAGQKGEPPQICRTGEEAPFSPVLFFCPPGPLASPPPASPATDEKARLEEVLAGCRYNKTLAAKQLGVSRSTLWRKLKLYGLT